MNGSVVKIINVTTTDETTNVIINVTIINVTTTDETTNVIINVTIINVTTTVPLLASSFDKLR